MPSSSPRRIAAMDSASSTAPQPAACAGASNGPPIAQQPKPIALTSVPPSRRFIPVAMPRGWRARGAGSNHGNARVISVVDTGRPSVVVADHPDVEDEHDRAQHGDDGEAAPDLGPGQVVEDERPE